MNTGQTRPGLPVPMEAMPPKREGARVSSDMIRAASHCDPETAKAAVEAIAEASFAVVYGREKAELKADAERLGAQIETASVERKAVATELATTPEWIAGAEANAAAPGGRDSREVRFRHWQLRHKITVFVAFLAALAVLATSWMSVSASLRDSGLPIFIENPSLAYLMAMVAPTASVAVKSAVSLVRQESTKKRVRAGIFAGAVVSFAGWLALFALKFEGVSGDFDPFAEPNPLTGWAFNTLQILTEVLVGAALFLHVEAIASIYAPDYYTANLKHEQLSRRLASLDGELDRLSAAKKAVDGRLAELDAERALARTAATLALNEHRSRYGDGLI